MPNPWVSLRCDQLIPVNKAVNEKKTMGDQSIGMFILFFGAWRPRRNLGIRFKLTILYFLKEILEM
jgi:hypothetical protein